jgi:glycosyltransferase involved in cell wall biosynthesis
MKAVVTLTAFNEAKTIGSIIAKIKALGFECIVVDDGSMDGTAEIAKSMGASLIRHIINLGQGYAVLTSFKAALSRNCSVIIEMDADGQHDPLEIPKFIKRMEETGADIVVGSRILGSNHPNAPYFRKIFLPHFTAAINTLTGYRMTDSMCGFRAFNTDSLRRVEPLLNSMLEPEYLAAEMFIRFAKAGLRVEEVPVNLHDRLSGQSYKGFIRYGFGVLKAIIRTLFDRGHKGMQFK